MVLKSGHRISGEKAIGERVDMFELMIETTFSAAHQLRGYMGKCEYLHGHNWKVQVHVSAEKLNEIDIAMDFHELKRLTHEVTAPLDHTFLNDVFPFTEKNPSSENIAKWIYDSLKKKITDDHVQVTAVSVWESDTASATYYED
jgi:6-pyruvoyltetrahydropterin/6-carboxytetrahydropterin synthase